MSSAERFSPITRLRKSAASRGVKRRSAARSSVSWPRARRRASGKGGSSRVAIDQVDLGRQVLDQKGQGLIYGLGIDRVVVIQDQDKALGDGGNLVEQGGQDRFDGGRLRGLEGGQNPLADTRGRPLADTRGRPFACARGRPFAYTRGRPYSGRPRRSRQAFRLCSGRPFACARGRPFASRSRQAFRSGRPPEAGLSLALEAGVCSAATR